MPIDNPIRPKPVIVDREEDEGVKSFFEHCR